MVSRTSRSTNAGQQVAELRESVIADLRKAQADVLNADRLRADAARRRSEAVRVLTEQFKVTHAELARELNLSHAAVGKIRDQEHVDRPAPQ